MKHAFRIKAWLACAAMAVGAHAAAQEDLVARGQYLARAGDCGACHTAPGGKAMAGGLPVDSPFGAIYASNITPSKNHGIGNYSEAQFARAVREGIAANGRHLYPAMPYPSYAGVSDDDIHALYAYFMHDVAPVDASAPVTRLSFPFNQRWLMGGWNWLFAGGKPGAPVAGQSAAWNRGHYLVNTLGHCDTCHTPRNVAMGEKTSLGLSGGQVGAWRAPNITSDPISGIGGWTEQELVQYLRTGAVAGKGQAAGGMAEAIQDSLQYLSDDDLHAIATYLKHSPPVNNSADKQPAYSFGGQASPYEPALRAENPGIGFHQPGRGYLPLNTGAQLYSAYCASCHQTSGKGVPDGAYPSLAHNSTLGRDNADNLVMVILQGLQIRTQGSERLMPGFADELDDEQVAALASFVMNRYGNPAVRVTADQVRPLRKGGPNPAAILLPAALGGLLAVLAALVALRYGRRRRRGR